MSTDPLLDRIEVVDRSASSAVVLHAPHGSRFIPPSSRPSFLLTDEQLDVELDRITDRAIDDLVRSIDGPSRVVHGLSRLVVDVERFEGDAEEMNTVGMGVLYTHGTHGQRLRHIGDAERDRLLEYFHAYGEAFATLVDRTLTRHGRAVIVDVHSYPATPLPYELHADYARPELCIGVDEQHTPPALAEAARSAFAGWETGANGPFRGSYVPLRHLGDARVSSVMLEVRRDRYLDPAGEVDGAALRGIGERMRRLVAMV